MKDNQYDRALLSYATREILDNIKSQQHKRSEEYKKWYEGDINQLLEFYKTGRDRNLNRSTFITPSFFHVAPTGTTVQYGNDLTVPNTTTIYHTPLANIISRAKSSLFFSNEPIVNIVHTDENTTKELTEELHNILKENEFGSMSSLMGEYDSYSGAIAIKPILDTDFSDNPIIQIYPKEQFLVNKKYDKLVSIIFIDEFQEGKDTFTLYSEHGKGFIRYKLFKADKEVSLSTLTNTQHLKDLWFVNETGEVLDELMAVYKENLPGARSDYENCIDDFMAADETYSAKMKFLRLTTPKRVMSTSTFMKNEEGKMFVPSSYDQDLVISRQSENGKENKDINEIQTVTDISGAVDGYTRALEEIQKNIARTVGLSIRSLIGEDASGANASAEALISRRDIDFQTRENGLKGYYEAYERLMKLLIILKSAEFSNNVVRTSYPENIEIFIEFYNPAKPTFEQLVKETRELVDSGLLDEYSALERVWFDTGLKSKEQVEHIYKRILGDKPETIDREEDEISKLINEEELIEEVDEDVEA